MEGENCKYLQLKFKIMGEQKEIRDMTQTNILEGINKLHEQCEHLNTLMVNRIQARDELINKLHEELDYYKKDSATKFENQLLKAVIKIRQDMKKKLISDFFEDKNSSQILQEFTYIFEDLTDLLEQQICDEIETMPGELFDPAIHQAKIEITEEESLDKTVKCSLTAGYKKDGKVLIPERVIVYQYKK